jgi:hypothetical protein
MGKIITILLLIGSIGFANEDFSDDDSYYDADYTDVYKTKKDPSKSVALKKAPSSSQYKPDNRKRVEGERSDRPLPWRDDDLEDDLK